MKAKILLIVACLPLCLMAQINFTTQVPSAGMLLKDQLWNVVITNNQNDLADLKLEIDIKDIVSGESVFNASSGKIIVGKGMKIITVKDVQPIIFNYVATDFASGYLPCGNYSARYRLSKMVAEGYDAVADEIINLNVSPLSPPVLNMPVDKSIVESTYPQFIWMPPAPMQMFNSLLYDLKVVTVDSGQSTLDAIEFNPPVYLSTNLRNPVEQMPGTYQKLIAGKTYAWQIIARNGSTCTTFSDVWQFTLNKDSTRSQYVLQAPFIRMKKSHPDKGIAPEGILKLSYSNETTEKDVILHISDPMSLGGDLNQKHIFINAGENLIEYDLNRISLKKGKLYAATIINERNERWSIQFEITQQDAPSSEKTK